MRSPNPVSTGAEHGTRGIVTSQGSGVSNATPQAGKAGQAAQGPIPEAVSAAENPLPAPPADSSAEARGRRTLSTAFVRVGPDGHLTVELHGGRVLVLRDVVMRPKDYCGIQSAGGAPEARYCGGYADVASARPGGGPFPKEASPMLSNPAGERRGS